MIFLGVDRTLTQLITTIFPFTAFVFPPILGKISDKIQNRFIFIIIGTIGTICILATLLFVQNVVLLIVLFLWFGFFNASLNVLQVLFIELVENDTKYITYLNAVIVVGWFVGSQSAGIFIEVYGIEHMYLFLLIISVINIFFVIFVKEKRSLILERHNEKVSNEKDNKVLQGSEEKIPISQSVYYGLFLRNFSIKPIFSVLTIIIAFHISSDTIIGFLIGINFLIQFFIIILIGRVITNRNVKAIMSIGYALSALAVFGYIISTNFLDFLLYQIVISFSFAMFNTATQVYIAQKTNPKNKGKYLGYANASTFSGSFLGGLFFSMVLGFSNSDYYLAMPIMIVFPLISALIILVGFERKKEKKT